MKENSISITPSIKYTIEAEPDTWYRNCYINITNISGESIDLIDSKFTFSLINPKGVDLTVGTVELHLDGIWHSDGITLIDEGIEDGHHRYSVKRPNSTLNFNPEGLLDLQLGVSSSQAVVVTPEMVVLEDVAFKNDPANSASLTITAPQKPNEDLGSIKAQALIKNEDFEQIVDIEWGESETISNIRDGKYSVSALDVKNSQGISLASDTVTTVEIKGSEESVEIEYDEFVYFGKALISVPKLEEVELDLSTTASIYDKNNLDTEVAEAAILYGKEREIYELLDGHSYNIQYTAVSVNNITYTPQENKGVAVKGKETTQVDVEIEKSDADTRSFTEVTIDISGIPSTDEKLRLSFENKENLYYFDIEASENQKLAEKIKPATYILNTPNVFVNGVRYVCDLDSEISVSGCSQRIELKYKEGINLRVKGFPNYVANGCVTINTPDAEKDWPTSGTNAVFKYEGDAGNGEPGRIFEELPSLPKTGDLAMAASETGDRKILPQLVVYTANFSGGAGWSDLQNDHTLYCHLVNMIHWAYAAEGYFNGDEKDSPYTFVLNPDFIGMLQQNNKKDWNRKVNLKENYAKAAAYAKEHFEIEAPKELPSDFGENVEGWVQAHHFIIKKVAPHVTFGWQINLWGTGSATWVHDQNDLSVEKGNEVVAFLKEMNIYSGEYKPDYIAFDKWERDDFSQAALQAYAFNATCYKRYLNFVKTITEGMGFPGMLWQTPGGHMPTQDEGTSMIEVDHQGSGGTFLMGDDRIGSNIDSIFDVLLEKPLTGSIYGGATNVRQLLEQDNGYDWSRQMFRELPKYNVFAVLWGGGSTTSITGELGTAGYDGGWLSDKINEYLKNPVYLD